MRHIALCLLACLSLWGVEIDKETGLKVAKGLDVVKANCTACHSASFITQSKLNREEWLAAIRWMQETQGLWEFDPETEDVILTYLSTQYPQANTSRRRPQLKAEFLPK
ncbi:hypothetical protein [Helicobacter pametensis]|uniref:hypothetical protein n=1 Tax=Helicobacter pametensis TaxID=95149 RepID=UPI0004B6D220|nr:hypothetical protein [Helicobacter pametensis]